MIVDRATELRRQERRAIVWLSWGILLALLCGAAVAELMQ